MEADRTVTEQHKRREGYWPYYEQARKSEQDFMRKTLLSAIRKNPHPCKEKKTNRGCKPVHSRDKMDFLCLLKVAKNIPFRDVVNELGHMHDEWVDEPKPDYSWVTKHMQIIDLDWLDSILAYTANMCLDELEKSGTDPVPIKGKETILTHGSEDFESGKQDVKQEPTAPIGIDSSGVETDRYEKQERPNHVLQDFEPTRIKMYLKYHITAITGHQIILASYTTPSNVSDTSMLPYMVSFLVKNYTQIEERLFNGDKGYDSDQNCEIIFNANMKPNIKQRNHTDGAGHTNRGKPSRKKAAEIFDQDAYKQRALIEAIFGAEETKNHRLHCRMRLAKNQKRFGKILSIAWNINVLNRFICAHEKGQKIPSYQ